MLCVGSNQSVAARIKMAQIEGIDKADKEGAPLVLPRFFYFFMYKCFCCLPFKALM